MTTKDLLRWEDIDSGVALAAGWSSSARTTVQPLQRLAPNAEHKVSHLANFEVSLEMDKPTTF